MSYISYHAHDLASVSVTEEGDAFPERVFIGEIIARQRFIDDHYRRSIGAIAFRDQTAFDQRDAKRFEEVRADCADPGVECEFRRRRPAFNVKAYAANGAAHRYGVDPGGCFDTGHSPYPLQCLLKEGDAPAISIL